MNGLRTQLILVFTTLVLFALQPGCNKVPVDAISGTYSVQAEIKDTRPDVPKLDVLFVVDNSFSMCEEQLNLAQNFDTFIKDFKDIIKADFRIAVVTTDASDNTAGKFREKQGVFEECSKPVNISACNSFTLPGGLITQQTANLETAFTCLAAVGTIQAGLANIEQGLKAAHVALDANGPMKTQVANFLRKDAFLVIVFVSDEDDCSWKDGVTWNEQTFSRCALFPDKLVPVGEYVKFFKRLKPDDPGRVLVAVISGDAVVSGMDASDPGFNTNPQVISQRETFLTKKAAGGQTTFICESDNGKADYGRRYRELVDKFGSNGVFANICRNDFAPALSLISKRIIDNIYSSCLTRPISTSGLRQIGQTCTLTSDCLNGTCLSNVCEALGGLGETCVGPNDCYSRECTGGQCTCASGNCPNEYSPYQKFVTVEKTLSNGTLVTLQSTDYEIKEQVKCVTDENPKGLAVVPNVVPEAGSQFRVVYQAMQL